MTGDRIAGDSHHRGRIAAGAGCAVAGQVVAAAPWLYNVYTFTAYAAPDSVFMVALLTAVLELALCAVCVTLGFGLLRSRQRRFGTGLLIGWLAGSIVVLGGGTVLIGVLAT